MRSKLKLSRRLFKLGFGGSTFTSASVFALGFALALITPMVGVSAWAATLEVDGATGTVNPGDPCPSPRDSAIYRTIQKAIDCALAGDTIIVAAGTYTEDLVIDKGDLELRPALGAAVTIKGIDTEPWSSFPLANPNIEIQSGGVKLHGFTIESPDVPDGHYSSGIVLNGTDVEIYDNTFICKGAGDGGCVLIQTYRDDILGYNSDISGLNIHDNTFSGTPGGGYVGVFINHTLEGTGTVYIQDNVFTGNIAQAIVTERSWVVIEDNLIVTDQTPAAGGVGIIVQDWDSREQSDVLISRNVIKGSGAGKGFAYGMSFGTTTQEQHDITVVSNEVTMNATGIRVRSALTGTGISMRFNNIYGNGVFGVDASLASGAVPLDAENNWWGDAGGPAHPGNPQGAGDPVSDHVDYNPWLGAPVEASETELESTPPGDYTIALPEADLELDKSGAGTPLIILAEYSGNPGGAPPFAPLGRYLDLYLDDPVGVSEITIRLYYTEAEIAGLKEESLRLYWWDGTSWVICSSSGVDVAHDYIWARIREDTVPALAELAGAPFGAGGVGDDPTSGFEQVLDLGQAAGILNPTDQAVVQRVYLADSDADPDPVVITTVEVDNLGSATADDISKIELWFIVQRYVGGTPTLTVTKIGEVENFTSFPVNVPLTAVEEDRTLPDDGEGWLEVAVTISQDPADGATIQTELGLHHSEGASGFYVETVDGQPEEIANPGFEAADKGKWNDTLNPGDQFPLQALKIQDDIDANDKPLLIQSCQTVEVDNLGTATAEHIAKLKLFAVVEEDGVVIEKRLLAQTEGFAAFPVVFHIQTPQTIEDDGSLQFWVEAKVTEDQTKAREADGKTVQFQTKLKVKEGETIATVTATDSEPEVIRYAGCEDVDWHREYFPEGIQTGAQNVEIQSFTCTDADVNSTDILVTTVEVEVDQPTKEALASLAIKDDQGNLIGEAEAADFVKTDGTYKATIVIKNPDSSDFYIPDGGCATAEKTCQDDPTGPSSETLHFYITLKADAEVGQTLYFKKTVNVEEDAGVSCKTKFSGAYQDEIQLFVGKATVSIADLELHAGSDEGALEISTDAVTLADFQVGSAGALIFDSNVPGKDAADIFKVTEVLDSDDLSGDEIPEYVVLAQRIRQSDVDGDGDLETIVTFAVGLGPGQSPRAGVIVKVKGEAVGASGDSLTVQLTGVDVFRDRDGADIPYSVGAPGTIALSEAAPEAVGDGDVNEDGVVDVTDARCTMQYALGITPDCEPFNAARADVALPKDVIDIADAKVIAQYVLGVIQSLSLGLKALEEELNTPLRVESIVNYPNPVGGGDDRVHFVALGRGIARIRVEIYDLAGKSVFDSGFVPGSACMWRLTADVGEGPSPRAANGVYLYIVTVKGFDGKLIRSEARKVVILR